MEKTFGCVFYLKKKGGVSKILLLPVALEIIERYKDHVQCQVKGKVLPVLSNQQLNSY